MVARTEEMSRRILRLGVYAAGLPDDSNNHHNASSTEAGEETVEVDAALEAVEAVADAGLGLA